MPTIQKFEPTKIGPKPWGTELLVAHTPQYTGKVLFMNAGGTGHLQYHEHKDETFFLFSGQALVEYALEDGTLTTYAMNEGEAFHVPVGAVHRVQAVSPCVFFEALYWIPFVKRFAKRHNIDPARLIPVTRGGAAVLYGLADGVDLFTLRTPKDVRIENRIEHAKHRQLKQTHWIDFDRAVIKDAAKALKLARYHTLHPGWMYARLGPYFDSDLSLRGLELDALYEHLTAPAVPADIELPEKFVAVRFYLRHTFPGQPQLIAFAQESIRQIASKTPVVLLHSGVHADEHLDIKLKPHPNVITLPELAPERNLAVLSAILARSLGFVGTYGGLAQLALRIGKPSVSYYHEWGGTSIAHKHLADAIALKDGLPCIVQKVGELPLLQTVAPVFTAQQLQGSKKSS